MGSVVLWKDMLIISVLNVTEEGVAQRTRHPATLNQGATQQSSSCEDRLGILQSMCFAYIFILMYAQCLHKP